MVQISKRTLRCFSLCSLAMIYRGNITWYIPKADTNSPTTCYDVILLDECSFGAFHKGGGCATAACVLFNGLVRLMHVCVVQLLPLCFTNKTRNLRYSSILADISNYCIIVCMNNALENISTVGFMFKELGRDHVSAIIIL
jgi:hypothetical protein